MQGPNGQIIVPKIKSGTKIRLKWENFGTQLKLEYQKMATARAYGLHGFSKQISD